MQIRQHGIILRSNPTCTLWDTLYIWLRYNNDNEKSSTIVKVRIPALPVRYIMKIEALHCLKFWGNPICSKSCSCNIPILMSVANWRWLSFITISMFGAWVITQCSSKTQLSKPFPGSLSSRSSSKSKSDESFACSHDEQ